MGKNRLEAFSDGVLAIIITIMVLDMKVPHGDTLGTLAPLVPVFMSYVLSFIYLGIYAERDQPQDLEAIAVMPRRRFGPAGPSARRMAGAPVAERDGPGRGRGRP